MVGAVVRRKEGKQDRGLYLVSVSYTEDLHSVGKFIQEFFPPIMDTVLTGNVPDADVAALMERVEAGVKEASVAGLGVCVMGLCKWYNRAAFTPRDLGNII